MANLPETPQWEEGIYQIEVSDPVLGGPDGISNRQAKQLAKRTSYLKQQVEKGDKGLADHIAAPDPHTQYAPKASPTFTGTPTAPTPVTGDNSKKISTTEYVVNAIANATGSNSELMKEIGKKLAKDQNGADIPDPVLFAQNIGLQNALKVGDFGLGSRDRQSAASNEHVSRFFYENFQPGTLYPDSVVAIQSGGPTLEEWGQIAVSYGNSFRVFAAHKSYSGQPETTELYHDKRKPTSNDVGAYPLIGGILNGNMSATGTVTSGAGKDISSGQDIWASRNIYESGNRVYSPNNKPTSSDTGSYPVTGGVLDGDMRSNGNVTSGQDKDMSSGRDIWATRDIYAQRNLSVTAGASVGLDLTVGRNLGTTGNIDAGGYIRSGTGRDVVSQNDIWASRNIYESGQRVYSPNNPPPAKFSKSLNTISWEKNLETGVIRQWGFVDAGDNGFVSITLPVAFPSSFLSLNVTPRVSGAVMGSDVVSAHGQILSNNSFGVGISANFQGGYSGVYFEAIGV